MNEIPSSGTHRTTPAPVSYLAYQLNHLFVGGDDGTLRIYSVSSPRVLKAVRGLGTDVSSVQIARRPGSSDNAEGAYSLSLDSDKLVLNGGEAEVILELGEDEDDNVNELSLTNKYLAFSTDAGSVGAVELSTHKVMRMKTRHQNICSTVKFIPNRPSELISGGYDCALLHFDFTQGTILSRLDISSTPSAPGVSLSPPFIQCTAMSEDAVLIAGLADGRVWIGGTDRLSKHAKKKRSRKWDGLKDQAMCVQAAEGPIVGIAFTGRDSFLTCTLLGSVSLYTMTEKAPQTGEELFSVDRRWTTNTIGMEKVNCFCVCGVGTDDDSALCYAVGGFDKDGKGVVRTCLAPSNVKANVSSSAEKD
ncbi:hypothetical protein PUNSTDRAFT_135933 [Punctularia strigosozonata HHB-11173 SS5]|uniref:uncharacterized protein n=1 Tax=Punctularia strigosozonata (strain HHB-11173) TaxID=741275 RepID=UPI000441821A|nr:uncharacterized protein PUNSTDRAFT_135933 [Punctularia strigosozonata HHB-11173 SS5]EIN07247.1 hypothetical protein PUNSTDRAFT_135933 [Punctularia strigosozonata HHB-11173 SS5]